MIKLIRTPLLDIHVTPMTAKQVVDTIQEDCTAPKFILNHNLHSAYLIRTDDDFRRLYTAAHATLIDGWPVYALTRIKNQIPMSSRIGSTDWIDALSGCKKPVRIFVLGATKQHNREAQERIRRKSTFLEVSGEHGYFDENEEAKILSKIRDFRPTLVLVGLGMPRQEHFLLRNLVDLPPAFYATVGGAIDYTAGAVALSPRWIGKVGLEWLWRLTHDPRRLAHRYVVEPFKLIMILIRDHLANLKGGDR